MGWIILFDKLLPGWCAGRKNACQTSKGHDLSSTIFSSMKKSFWGSDRDDAE